MYFPHTFPNNIVLPAAGQFVQEEAAATAPESTGG